MTKQRDKTTANDTPHGGERERDEQRTDAGPQYGGGSWSEADRGENERFGHARNDAADPVGLVRAEQDEDADDADPDRDAVDASGEIDSTESGGERAGMGRGEQPRKSKQDEK